jgi:hypothetical protein|tara:strand:- start:113 stop:1261 length:1149 start_codon:yes stop_codon:yes gene_type:complete
MKDKIDIIREVAFEIDKFELKHYNEEVRGCFERVQKDLHDVQETIDKVADEKFTEAERLNKLKEAPSDIDICVANANTEIDQMESIGVQNGLVRSKHLQNLLQSARERGYAYHNPDVDHVSVKLPWYLVDNLLEKLYLKYHKTKIHKCFDIVHKYLLDDYDNADNARGIYVFWKEIQELWEEVDDEETLSNHYHDGDNYWEHGVDPKYCKNLKDFFKKRITRINRAKRKEVIRLQKEEIALRKKEAEVKKLQAKEHKLRNYLPLKKYGEGVPGSVYWFKDINKKFQKNKHGILYVGESRNFHKRFSAYQPRENGRLTELETKLQNRFPKIDKEVIQQFVRDPKQCRMRVISHKFLSDNWKRRNYESRVIRIVKPLLNRSIYG